MIIVILSAGCSPFRSWDGAAVVRAFSDAVSGQSLVASEAPKPLNPENFSPDDTFYVDQNGSDANDCSQAAPCRQVARALQLVSGDQEKTDLVSVGAGHFEGFVVTGHESKKDAFLMVRGVGNQTVFDSAVLVSEAENLSLENLSIVTAGAGAPSALAAVGASDAAAVALDRAKDVFLRSLYVSGDFAIGVAVKNSLRVTVSQSRFEGSSAMAAALKSQDAVLLRVVDNIIEDAGVGVWVSGGREFKAERNRLAKQESDAVRCAGVRGLMIANNVIFGTRGYGVALQAQTLDAGVYHNTVVTGAQSPGALRLDDGAKAQVFNNILLSENSKAAVFLADLETSKDNLVTARSLTSVFAGFNAHDFELSPGSEARGQGVALELVRDDHFGRPRPSAGKAVDLGAYERGGARMPAGAPKAQ